MKIRLERIVFCYDEGPKRNTEITLIRYRPIDIKGSRLPECWHFVCPACKNSGYIDEDQYFGRVSILCSCGNFHETINFKKIINEII